MDTRIARSASWAAYLSGVAGVAAMLSLILFFALEAYQPAPASGVTTHIWGPISDICPIIQMLFLLVVARALYAQQKAGAPRLTLLSGMIGIVGMLSVALLQFLLIIKVIPFEQEVGPVVLATAAVGVWLIAVSYSGARQEYLSSWLAWFGIATGVAFVLEPVFLALVAGAGDWKSIASNYPLLAGCALVFLVAYVGFPLWAIGLGRVLAAANRASVSTLKRPAPAGG